MTVVVTSTIKNDIHLAFVERELDAGHTLVVSLHMDVSVETIRNTMYLLKKYPDRVHIVVSRDALIQIYNCITEESAYPYYKEKLENLHYLFKPNVMEDLLSTKVLKSFLKVMAFFESYGIGADQLKKPDAFDIIDYINENFPVKYDSIYVDFLKLNLLGAYYDEESNTLITHFYDCTPENVNAAITSLLENISYETLLNLQVDIDNEKEYTFFVSPEHMDFDFGLMDNGTVYIGAVRMKYVNYKYKNVKEIDPICMFNTTSGKIFGLNSLGLNYDHSNNVDNRHRTFHFEGMKHSFRQLDDGRTIEMFLNNGSNSVTPGHRPIRKIEDYDDDEDMEDFDFDTASPKRLS